MKRSKVVAGVCTAAVCAACAGLLIPNSNNVKTEENNNGIEVESETADFSGNFTVSTGGITTYLDELSINLDDMNNLTGSVSFTEAGISSVLNTYGDYLSEDGNASSVDMDEVIAGNVEVSNEDSNTDDVANDNDSVESIIVGYTNLGISNVSDYLNVRKGPGLDQKVIGKMPGNCACEIISEENDWYKIKSGDVEGYVYSKYILKGNAANVKAKETMKTELQVSCSVLNVRQEPSTECNVSTSVFEGEVLEILEELNGWYKVDINNLVGYVCADYVKKINSLPTAVEVVEVVANTTYKDTSKNKHKNDSNNNVNSNSKPSNITYTNLDSTVSQQAVDLINYAMQFLGNPYVSGGNSLTNGTDCSGFTMLVFQHFGYSLPRASTAYLSTGYTYIPVDQAKPGDLFLYNYGSGIGHVGIYVGNGQLLHASTPSQGIKLGGAFYTQPYCALRVIP